MQAKTNHYQYSSEASSSIKLEDAICLLGREMVPDHGESFLAELANLKQTDSEAISRFLKKYPKFVIPPQMESGKALLASGSPAATLGLTKVNDSLPRAMFNIQHLLRSAWKRPTPFEREVSLELTKYTVCASLVKGFSAQQQIWQVFGNIFIALMAATRLADRFRYCENPNCPAPYFIAKRRTEKYCAEVCANVAQRKQKKAWWSEHGEEWRKNRPKKNKLKKDKGPQS
jgi:hypothetical protein